jgi:hypothetical protein
MRRAAAVAVLLAVALLLPAAAHAQGEVRVRDIGPGRAGRIVRDALASPHVLVRGDSAAIIAFPRDTVYPTTIIVLGASATVASTVHGDVIVVGGDLWMHPGAVIDGRAIAIGGGAYNSTLAVVHGGLLSFRDLTFEPTIADGVTYLDYRELGGARPRRFGLGGIYGLGLPDYTRVDGLALPFSVRYEQDEPALTVEPSLTWRTHLGEIDPYLEAEYFPSRRTRLQLEGGRSTRTNDAWIRSDPLNSVMTLAIGRDTRNYYRADHARLVLARVWEGASSETEPFVGAMIERAWSVGPTETSASAPWSLVNRRDSVEGMLRPNPPVERGRIASGILGASGEWESGGVQGRWWARGEIPVTTPDDSRWQQLTLDAEAGFQTFGTHRLDLALHTVTTFGDVAPPQRFAYLGGSGTLPTFDLLTFGGDQLLFAEGRYTVPIDGVVIRFLGSPRVVLRYMIGSAGVDELPSLEQNIGLRLALGLFKVDWTIEPIDRDTEFSFGLSFGR